MHTGTLTTLLVLWHKSCQILSGISIYYSIFNPPCKYVFMDPNKQIVLTRSRCYPRIIHSINGNSHVIHQWLFQHHHHCTCSVDNPCCNTGAFALVLQHGDVFCHCCRSPCSVWQWKWHSHSVPSSGCVTGRWREAVHGFPICWMGVHIPGEEERWPWVGSLGSFANGLLLAAWLRGWR